MSARTPPIRWVSRQELAWDGEAAWTATLGLLEREDPASFSAEQRTAWLVWSHARGLESGERASSDAELAAALARVGCARTANSAELLRALRAWCAAFEPCFVREDRPGCSS